jgi:Ca2+-binding RTX toxin-like protein
MVVLWSTLPASAALAAHGGTWHVVERVSVASDGSQANGGSYDAAVSGDGRVVAFSSGADNLVSGDGNGRQDVFVHDRATGRTRRVSVASDGSQANRYSYGAAVSGDGRVVAFWSEADNLVTGDSNDTADMFVHDRATGRTERVSVASDGSQVNDSSFRPAVSGDGRIVVFDSFARNLVPGDSNNAFDVFVAERAASGPVCTVTGSAGDDVLIGTAGDDVLCGRGGDDGLLGRGGDDLLRGGRGGDRLRGGWGADRLGGRRGPDRLYGGYGPDRLYGGYGDDVLRGGPGPDRLRGGPGDDLLFGGPGDDRLRGNRGVDLLPERHD